MQLIKSLPEEYFKDISTIVNNGYLSGARYDTIAKQITAKTGSEGLKVLKDNEIHLVICDQRMPDMGFLERLKMKKLGSAIKS